MWANLRRRSRWKPLRMDEKLCNFPKGANLSPRMKITARPPSRCTICGRFIVQFMTPPITGQCSNAHNFSNCFLRPGREMERKVSERAYNWGMRVWVAWYKCHITIAIFFRHSALGRLQCSGTNMRNRNRRMKIAEWDVMNERTRAISQRREHSTS